ncbi:LOW QUALITY PROTEIN: taste receptor type 2 member 62-like [Otolemur garnettii]|uniref:LOW QUALITY PROTEIN: taste receptor type 2 member 62-like n=1 Tax=Otolemur garnettii TaxID=30611 RepID=UPI000C7EBCB8|nr:LOW QUALITY PROTEIN: taste receptor type 2 member 62-like [Otolemur garnettii]
MSFFTSIFLVIFCLESLAAMLQNGFIVTVLGREWIRGQKLPAGDMIVACIATSRLGLHGVALLNGLLGSINFCCKCYLFFNIIWDFFNVLSFWHTAWLAVFYCVKISSFSHPTFFWLKWRVSRSVPRLMLGSLIICGLTVISSMVGNLMVAQMMASLNSCGNSTLTYKIEMFKNSYFMPHEKIIILSVPFLLFLTSTILLMFSLCRHLGRMQDRGLGPRDPSTQAHTVALKSLAFFFIFYVMYFLSLNIAIMEIKTFTNYWHWGWEVAIYAGISLHSTILVLNSPKLRKALQMRLRTQVPQAHKALEGPGQRAIPCSSFQC